MRTGHPLYQNFETILQKVPVELRDRMNRRHLPEDTPTDPPNERALVRLHKQVIKVRFKLPFTNLTMLITLSLSVNIVF